MDNGATTCVCDGAIEKMACMLKEKYGNPSSLHQKGIEAEKEMTRAREAIAKVLSVDKGEIYFTSGGTGFFRNFYRYVTKKSDTFLSKKRKRRRG